MAITDVARSAARRRLTLHLVVEPPIELDRLDVVAVLLARDPSAPA